MSGERVSFTVEDLVIGEQYQFAAQAYNGFDFSEFSNDSNIVTVTEGKIYISTCSFLGLCTAFVACSTKRGQGEPGNEATYSSFLS